MKMYADTEFNEYNGQTISLGIVADNGTEFYEVLPMAEPPTEWVAANVMPILGKAPLHLELFKIRLHTWLRQFVFLEIVVDHPADVYRFLYLLEVDEQGGWAEVPQVSFHIVTGLPGKQRDYSFPEHNALSDARALRDRCRDREKNHG